MCLLECQLESRIKKKHTQVKLQDINLKIKKSVCTSKYNIVYYECYSSFMDRLIQVSQKIIMKQLYIPFPVIAFKVYALFGPDSE